MNTHISPFNLLRQNCFVLDSVSEASTPHSDRANNNDRYSSKTYVNCSEKTVADGLKIEFVDVPYEITPESVKSYSQSADYHNNLQEVLSNPKPVKPGLKNVSELQHLLNSDPSVARELYSQLQARFGSSSAAQTNITPIKNDTDNKKEVNDVK